MCLRRLALVLSALLVFTTVAADAKKGGWGKGKGNSANWVNPGNGNGNGLGNGNGNGLGNVNPLATGNGNLRSTGQHAINALQPTGQARATAQHTLNAATKAGKGGRFGKLFKGWGRGKSKNW